MPHIWFLLRLAGLPAQLQRDREVAPTTPPRPPVCPAAKDTYRHISKVNGLKNVMSCRWLFV